MSESAFTKLTIEDFLARLASDAPTPGGGVAAALVGTLAAGLGQMACALTLGRPKFADVEPRVQDIAARLKRAGRLLTELMEEDADAYQDLSDAFKIPKDEPTRPERIRHAASLAAAIPFQIVTMVRKLRLDLARLAPLANPNLQSDVEVGLHLASAAMHGAAVMVRVNLPLLAAGERGRIETELTTLLAERP